MADTAQGPRHLDYRAKLQQTAWISVVMVGVGASVAIRGPTLLDLQLYTGSTMQQISVTCFTCIALGWLLGSTIFGVLYDRYNKQMLLFLAAMFSAVTMAAVPWCSNLYHLGITVLLNGGFLGAFDTGAVAMCIAIWQKDSGPYMQAADFLFALGAFVTPFIVEPLLGSELPVDVEHALDDLAPSIFPTNEKISLSHSKTFAYNDETDGGTAGNVTVGYRSTDDSLNSTHMFVTDKPFIKDSQFQYAYLIIAIYILASGIPFLVNYFRKINIMTSDRNIGTDIRAQRLNSRFKWRLLLLAFFMYFFFVGLEESYAGFVTTFVVKYLNWSKRSGALLPSMFWGTHAAARALAVVAVKFLHPGTLLISVFILQTVTLIVQIFSYHRSDNVVWVCAGLLGASMAPIYANTITWTDRYIVLNGKIMGYIHLAIGCGGMAMPPTVAYLCQRLGGIWFLYMCASMSLITTVVFALMYILALQHGERYDTMIEAKDETLTNSGHMDSQRKEDGDATDAVELDETRAYSAVSTC